MPPLTQKKQHTGWFPCGSPFIYHQGVHPQSRRLSAQPLRGASHEALEAPLKRRNRTLPWAVHGKIVGRKAGESGGGGGGWGLGRGLAGFKEVWGIFKTSIKHRETKIGMGEHEQPLFGMANHFLTHTQMDQGMRRQESWKTKHGPS